MPSCPSMMNSCGSTCRIFWSAGIATALAASITCATSISVTSRSRIATTPCEFRLRTWLPAMPAYTEWISQPAISSASSTARWIDCTVDSMLTTTPFLRPRDGCEPRPITSIEPSGPISPTSATTFDVPMSRPTIRWRSLRLATVHVPGVALAARRAPADREAVCVAQVDIGDLRRARVVTMRAADAMKRSKRSSICERPSRTATPLSSDSSHAPRASSRSSRQPHACFHQSPLRRRGSAPSSLPRCPAGRRAPAAPPGCGARR